MRRRARCPAAAPFTYRRFREGELKIRLIEPKPPSLHLMSPWRYPRLGLPMIGAALAADGHDVRIACEQMAPLDWDDLAVAELVGISTTTSTAPSAYAISDRLRAGGVPVVIGGSHVTFMADEVP
jgi:anaerobic magnesium-protoporphyrin IX monomethyl ester cyclase